MAEEEPNPFTAIEVDPDAYASILASDTPPSSISRTHQSETAFRAIQSTYTAKLSGSQPGSTYKDLIAAVPILRAEAPAQDDDSSSKVVLSKKDVQLLGYAVGELYYERDFKGVVGLCERVRERCVVEGKVEGGLGRWAGRAEAREREREGG